MQLTFLQGWCPSIHDMRAHSQFEESRLPQSRKFDSDPVSPAVELSLLKTQSKSFQDQASNSRKPLGRETYGCSGLVANEENAQSTIYPLAPVGRIERILAAQVVHCKMSDWGPWPPRSKLRLQGRETWNLALTVGTLVALGLPIVMVSSS